MIDLSENKFERYIKDDDVLRYVSELEIFFHYVPDLIHSLKLIRSPLRSDTVPSFGVFWSERYNRYLYTDNATGNSGNCFRLVSQMYNIDYNEAIIKICHDMKIPLLDSSNGIFFNYNPEKFDALKIKKNKAEIKFNQRYVYSYDIKFWESFGVSKNILQIYRVVPISYLMINSFVMKTDKLSYAYLESKDNINTVKSYQPYSTNAKFMNNNDSSVIEGFSQLPNRGKKLIITSSRKDLMSIVSTCRIPSIAPQSENIMIKESVMNELRNRFDNIYVLYDNDYTKENNPGRISGKKLADKYDIRQIEIDSKHKSKDYSDLVRNHSVDYAKNVLKSMI